MKNKLGLCLVFIIFSFVSFSQVVTGSYFYDAFWQPAKSTSVRYYQCDYKKVNDKLYGLFECYLIKTGQVLRTYNYQNNVLHGDYLEFYADSSIHKQGQFSQGNPVDVWTDFDEQGNIIAQIEYDSTGKLINNVYEDEDENFNVIMGISNKKEEPAIFGTNCIMLAIDNQKYQCSDSLLKEYYANPPMPPKYRTGVNAGNSTFVDVQFVVTRDNEVIEAEVISSCGDTYIDWLSIVHVENMIPWEAGKIYGTPINTTHQARIIFNF